ncbi:hypothetical protein GF312_15590 [Candidatus Poribacteria bacterium]|nr:hypothetical protein [Candidatus Poribacteria bacterium]
MNPYSIEGRKQRWRDFLSMNNVTRFVYHINYQPDNKPRPWPWPDNKDQRIEWSWERYQRHLDRTQWLNDDSIPYLDVYTGTEIFAEAFGCEIYRPEDNMPFALPMIHNAREVAGLKVPDLSVQPFAMLFEIADELRKRAGKDAIMRLVDIQSPMDIAALIWDKNDLYIAMIETPEAVKELSGKVTEFMINFLDEWFNRYNREFIAHYPVYYMPEGITLSEDEVGIINDEMFLEFFMPELKELSYRYGGIGVHCCADARHQWDNFSRIPELRLLNLVQPVNELKEAYNFFAHRVPQMHSWFGEGPAWTWPGQYPGNARVVMEVGASSKDEALNLADKLHKSCGRN